MRTLGRWLVADLVARYVLAPIAARILTARQWRRIDPGETDFGGDE